MRLYHAVARRSAGLALAPSHDIGCHIHPMVCLDDNTVAASMAGTLSPEASRQLEMHV